LNSKDLKKEWKQSSRGLESRVKKGIELAVKHKLKIIMPKNENNNIPMVRFINDRWVDQKVEMTDREWEKMLHDF